jgi:hypothetical protein
MAVDLAPRSTPAALTRRTRYHNPSVSLGGAKGGYLSATPPDPLAKTRIQNLIEFG